MKKVIKWVGFNIAVLCMMHTAEWFLEGRKVADAAGIDKKEALKLCLLKGILWWKPLKEELGIE